MRERMDGYWCPIELFFNMQRLNKVGAVARIQRSAEMSERMVNNFYSTTYSEEIIWLDTLPHSLRISDSKLKTITFSKYDLGCELKYAFLENVTIHTDKPVRGFIEEFGNEKADILRLNGIPHSIGRTPVVWSSVKAQREFDKVLDHVMYHHEIISFAGQSATRLIKSGNSYNCVHLRRGDFVSLGWIEQPCVNLEMVISYLQKFRLPNELTYIATNERNETERQKFHKIGGIFWNDLFTKFNLTTEFSPTLKNMIAFEDYIEV